MSNDPVVSKSAANRAADVLRRFRDPAIGLAELRIALSVIEAFRRQYEQPMEFVWAVLESLRLRDNIEGVVTRRLKKMSTITDKLSQRETTLQLSQMQDLGGCRVVFPSLLYLERMRQIILDYWGDDVIRVRDYVAEPRSSGYRGIHIVVLIEQRPIEIQLRTAFMHEWALVVEMFSAEFGANLKQDAGDHPVQRMMKVSSEIYCYFERQEPAPQSLMDQLRTLGDEVVAAQNVLRLSREEGNEDV